jgi:haloalkane dehalogenase
VVGIVSEYAAWLAESEIPKLYIRADPGAHSKRMIEQIRRWPQQQEFVVKAIHYPQEDAPDEVAAYIAAWLHMLQTVRR